jgi:hypothetical protein
MYGFTSTIKPCAVENNIKLARELKHKFAFIYAVHCFIIFVRIDLLMH